MVWSAWWTAGSILEGSWTCLQLYFPLVRICYTTHSLCKVSINLSSWFNIKFKQNLKTGFHSFFFIFNRSFYLSDNSNIYYINDKLDKRTWTYIFGACCATTVFIPSFHNYRIWSFLGLGMTTYTAWYLAIAALVHGQVKEKVKTNKSMAMIFLPMQPPFSMLFSLLFTYAFLLLRLRGWRTAVQQS